MDPVLTHRCPIHLYADDTVLYCAADSVQPRETTTLLRCFVFSDIDRSNLHISAVNSLNIERVTEHEHPGIWLDDIRTLVGKF